MDLVGRVTEDKFVARFIFLPVGLGLAVLYLRDRGLSLLLLFTFVCWSVAIVHPLGLGLVGVCVTGFGLVHLATNLRDKSSWMAFGGLAAAVLSIGLPPVAYLLASGSPLLSVLEATGPGTSTSLIDAWVNQYKLLVVLGDGSYIMHPSLLLSPAMLATYLIGVPFLAWHLKESLAARLLLGVLLFIPILIYIPPIATFIAGIIGPWMIHRLSWPMLLVAPLTLGWVAWEILSFLGSRLARSGYRAAPWVVSLLPLLMVVGLAVVAAPLEVEGVRAADRSDKIAQESGSCMDPTFPWMQDTITSPHLVLAPDLESGCVPAYAASAKVTGFRYSGGQTWDKLLKASAVTPYTTQEFQYYGVGYILLPVGSPLNAQLEHIPGVSRMDNPGHRYRVYRVDPGKIQLSPAIVGNEYLEDGDPDAALAQYKTALQSEDKDQWFLAYMGLGQLYAREAQFSEAAQNYEEALALDPNNPTLYPMLAEAYQLAGEQDAARETLEKGVTLFPRDVSLHTELAWILQFIDQKAAVEEYQTVVDMYPKVPEYHVQLGSALNQSNDYQAADEEFGRAISLDPSSAELRFKVGFANQQSGRQEEAARGYEETLKLAPDNQFYTFELGYVYFLLSLNNSRNDDEYFTRAEGELKRVMELEPTFSDQSRGKDLRSNAQLTLGDLYRSRGRLKEAAAAYEEALSLDPDLKEAERKLEEIRQK
jgi:tetratricopeptide (TPR) repeat protein